MNSTKASKRILALDILRGVTIAGMIMVNNPGSWGHIYAPLRHAEWNGLTPTTSSFLLHVYHGNFHIHFPEEYNFEFSHAAGMKILKRTIVIFLIGMAIGWFSRFCYYSASAPTTSVSREAMGFRLDIRPYPYSGCHATAGPLLRSSLHHCTNHEA